MAKPTTKAPERDSKGRLKKGVVLNPKGKPKGTKNTFTKDIAEIITDTLRLAGERVKKTNKTMAGVDSATAYMLNIAETRPELFVPLIRQMMPAKIDVDVQIMGRELVDLMAQRREQLAKMRDITPEEEHDD